MKRLFSLSAILFLAFSAKSQQIKILTEGNKTSIRGLSVVNDKIFWASGSNGMVARSVDGGATIGWQQIKGYEKRDFRDVEAFDSNTAIIMGVDWPAIILKTKDGGKNWYKVFEDSTKGMFLDAMEFNNQDGYVIGDPVNGKMFKAYTTDFGETWKTNTWETYLKEGEAFFASSGSNIKFLNFNNTLTTCYAVSGGKSSRLINLFDQKIFILPIVQGKESTGANSIDINLKTRKGIVVGGDFMNDKDTILNCVLINFNAVNPQFSHPQTSPHGYKSCVIYTDENSLIACGTSGIDISKDGGMNWQFISNESFHVVQKAKKGSSVFLAGGKGRIAQLFF